MVKLVRDTTLGKIWLIQLRNKSMLPKCQFWHVISQRKSARFSAFLAVKLEDSPCFALVNGRQLQAFRVLISWLGFSTGNLDQWGMCCGFVIQHSSEAMMFLPLLPVSWKIRIKINYHHLYWYCTFLFSIASTPKYPEIRRLGGRPTTACNEVEFLESWCQNNNIYI